MEKMERKEERKIKDYRLVVGGWFAYKNDLPQYPAKIYEVREKAINCLFFKKAEKEGEKDKPLYKWVPVSQLVVRGDYSILEGLINDLFKSPSIKNTCPERIVHLVSGFKRHTHCLAESAR